MPIVKKILSARKFNPDAPRGRTTDPVPNAGDEEVMVRDMPKAPITDAPAAKTAAQSRLPPAAPPAAAHAPAAPQVAHAPPMAEPHRPGHRVVIPDAPPLRKLRSATPRSPEPESGPPVAIALPESPLATARAAIVASFYRDFGQPSSMLEHPHGRSFALRADLPHGEVYTPHALSVPLPDGHATRHGTDLCMQLENGALLVLDILPAHAPLVELKAHAFDALQLRRLPRCYTVLVLIRTAGGLPQSQVEALAHGYDLVFGLPEDKAHSDFAYAALKSRIATWLAASKGP